MLVEFRVANFRSFNEEQTLSLVASKKDDKHPDNMIPCDKFRLLKAISVHGPNASGKSNLIKAINCMRLFIVNSATAMNLGDPIRGIEPFRLATDTREKPSYFEVVVVVDDIRFEYGFSATAERVHSEWLIARPPAPKRRQEWFRRELDLETGETSLVCREPFKKADERMLKEKTRRNGLVLSRAAELNIEAVRDLFLWFRKNLRVFDLSDRPENLMITTARRAKESQSFQDQLTLLIRHADLGIDRLTIDERAFRVEDFPEAVRQIVSKISETRGEPSITGLSVQTFHRLLGSDEHVQFDFSRNESNGTQRFFAIAGPLLDAIRGGATMVVDELECSMHPLLTRKLIELFQSPEANKSGGQLVFASHDSTLMDPQLFRRDQLWLVEKDRSGASELFSLYDFDTKERPRNTEAFQRNYLAGRYGGVPDFGPTFEDLELK